MNNIIYKIGISLVVAFGLTVLLTSIPLQAAEFIQADEGGNISVIDQTVKHENLYLASTNITLKTPVDKDLYIAGTNINVTSDVERSGFLAGSVINVTESKFGAGLKIVGSNVIIENTTITEDLFIAASTVTLKNVSIEGDLLITTSTIVMTDSKVEKNMYYSGNNNNLLKDQVKGELYSDDKSNTMEYQKNFNFSYFDIMLILSGLVVLCFEIAILNKYNRLWDPKIGFSNGGSSFRHLGYGVLAFFSIFGLIIFSILSAGLLAPLFINLSIILTLLFFLFSPLSSYYLANIFFGKDIKWWHCLAVFAAITVLTYLPVIGFIFGLIMAVVNLMTIGYYLNKFWVIKINDLKQNQPLLGQTDKIISDL